MLYFWMFWMPTLLVFGLCFYISMYKWQENEILGYSSGYSSVNFLRCCCPSKHVDDSFNSHRRRSELFLTPLVSFFWTTSVVRVTRRGYSPSPQHASLPPHNSRVHVGCTEYGGRCYLNATWKKSNGKLVGHRWTPAVCDIVTFSFALISVVYCSVFFFFFCSFISRSFLLVIKWMYRSKPMLWYFANDNLPDGFLWGITACPTLRGRKHTHDNSGRNSLD